MTQIKQMTTDEKFMMNKNISENLFNLCHLCAIKNNPFEL